MNNQKGFSPIIITLIILALAGIGGASYYLVNEQPSEPTSCGTETKVCPDGSLVGRTGPNCEFASCPEAVDETTNWKTYTDSDFGFEIKYPSNWNSPFENWGPGFTTGISMDNYNYCVVDVNSNSGSNDAEKADLIGKGYIKTLIKIDGIDGVRLTKNPAGAGLTEAVYFEANDKSFRIGRNRGSGDKIEQDCINNFNQILSTFKFIDTTQNSDDQTVEIKSSNGLTCYENSKYFVVSKSDGVNNIVKYKAYPNQKFACEYVVSDNDFKFGEGIESFEAFSNDFLITDNGTGPDGRWFTVYDLNSRQKVYSAGYDRSFSVKDNSIFYWSPTNREVNNETCPELSEYIIALLGAQIAESVVLDLNTLTRRELGEYQCMGRQ